ALVLPGPRVEENVAAFFDKKLDGLAAELDDILVHAQLRYPPVPCLPRDLLFVPDLLVVRPHLFFPKHMRETLTLDNGTEFARFKEIERRTGLRIYFADPYAAWQRGTNENTNGLLRRYFPKGSDFSHITKKTLALVVKKLNHRPRKCLDFQTPHEVFSAAVSGALGT
ncbi:IS30 family transposase, partial [Parvibium lacunae]